MCDEGGRRRTSSLPRNLDLAGRRVDVTGSGRSGHNLNPDASGALYSRTFIGGNARVIQGDLHQTSYNTYQNSNVGASSRPPPRTYLSDSAIQMFSGIAGGLVVAGLNGLIQRLKRASSGSDSTRQAQDQYMIDS